MRILIAEDEVNLGHLLKEQLSLWGYEAAVVHDGLAALEALRAVDAPRLALLDWLMPGLDGIEVCRRLRQDGYAYPYLILLTGQGGREQMIEGLAAGADEFLTKPVDAAELKARLGAGRRIVALQEQLREQASRDALTGLYNRGAILAILDREVARGQREDRPVGVLLADLDHFKQVNDTLGHLAGDEVLRQTARRMGASLRPYDGLGRYGGEEFLAVLPGCGAEDATALAERLRACVAAEPIVVGNTELHVTMSVGVAAWNSQEEGDAMAVLQTADTALYMAKEAGRDCTIFAAGRPTPVRGPHRWTSGGAVR
jgi:diguanylate cyclase (GGDEF)-like protein